MLLGCCQAGTLLLIATKKHAGRASFLMGMGHRGRINCDASALRPILDSWHRGIHFKAFQLSADFGAKKHTR